MPQDRTPINKITTDLRSSIDDSAKELQNTISQFAVLQDLLKNADPSTIKDIFKLTGVGDFIKELGDAELGVEGLLKKLDQLKKTNKDINVINQLTKQGYEESAAAMQKLYIAKEKYLDTQIKAAGAGTKQQHAELENLKAQISAVEKLTTAYSISYATRQKEQLSFSKLIEEKFGKQTGSAALGALMGQRSDPGNFGQYLLQNIGASSGISSTLQESKIAKMMAKGFDLSDVNRKTSTNVARSADTQDKELKEVSSQSEEVKTANRKNLGLGSALLMGGAYAGWAGTGLGIRGAGQAYNTISEMGRNPYGLDKALYGNIGGAVVGKVFGDRAGGAFSGIVGQITDALSYTKQREWETSHFGATMRQTGFKTRDFNELEQNGPWSIGEYQSLVKRWERSMPGGTLGKGGRLRNLAAAEQAHGEDVIKAGYDTISSQTFGHEKVLSRVVQITNSLKESSTAIGVSYREVAKQIFATGEATRFLNVDIRGIIPLYKSLFAGAAGALKAVGVDTNNFGRVLTSILSIGSSKTTENLGMSMWLMGDEERKKYRTAGGKDTSVLGAMMRFTPAGMQNIKWEAGTDGWKLTGPNLKGLTAQQQIDFMKNESLS